MVIGLGIDVVEIARFRKALRDSRALAERVFTLAERSYCESRKRRYQHFAGRFAAKEAALKALGTGWQQGIGWQDVEILEGDLGKPELHLHGKAAERAASLGASSSLVSISHAGSYAVAVAVLETTELQAKRGDT